ncbi:ATP-binding protein [Kitasatospora sp. NPDC091207]|uniref:ATP-binding protein n=1 Tax=Kitasatospora sp. NPDC091207 TaxID=3364083 RepID=UPI00381D3EDC
MFDHQISIIWRGPSRTRPGATRSWGGTSEGPPQDPAAVPPARRLVVAILPEWGVPLSGDALGEVELCAGEVIANAVEHAGGRCAVRVEWWGERLRVEVADAGASLARSMPEQEGTCGRGLLLVEALALTWGRHPVGTGKVVWFEYAVEPSSTHGWGTANFPGRSGRVA